MWRYLCSFFFVLAISPCFAQSPKPDYLLAVDPKNIGAKTILGMEIIPKVQLQALIVDAATKTNRIPVDNIVLRYVISENGGAARAYTHNCQNADYCERTLESYPILIKVYCWTAIAQDAIRGNQTIQVGNCPTVN